jgi:hypothetical protein
MSLRSPTQRTLREMRLRGYHAEVTEHWNGFMHKRKDMWGFCDVICLGDGEIIAVQTTSATNVAARINKIAEHENTPAVRKAGIRILVHGWKKGKNGRYTLREVDVS